MPTNYISYISENRCLYCNELVPEGRMICPCCEKKLSCIRAQKKEPKNSFFTNYQAGACRLQPCRAVSSFLKILQF